ncbi:MAG TPA: P-loop NTPase [Myxococcota bacterium]|nr:P-loop NTPase [Myxococcota bacterium]
MDAVAVGVGAAIGMEAPRRARAAETEAAAAPGPRIYAIGGGKGGVGKSIVASNLALALAATGQRTAVVDVDLGGANLHTLFGVARPRHTLTDFVRGEVAELADLLVPTSVPDVALVSGARALPDMANPKHAQKSRLLRHLRRLPVQHVVLDLGAGSGFNVVDFFLAADCGLVVVTPEPTALDNAMQFLKAAFFRSLREVACEERVRKALESVLEDARKRGFTPRELVEAAGAVDLEAGRLLRERVRRFAPFLVLNQVQSEGERRLGLGIQADCAAYLGAPLEFLGTLDRDACVPAAVSRGLPVMQLYPGSGFAHGIRGVADRLRDSLSGVPAAQRRAARPSAAPAPPAARPRPQLPPLDLEQPGAYLRRCRETLALDLPSLSEVTRIRFLAEIEAERFDRLPPQPYLAAHVRLYAQVLGIPEAGRLAVRYVERAHAPLRGQ